MPGHGFKDNLTGDILMVAPPFIVKKEEIDEIADKLEAIIRQCGQENFS
jgi:adenosylmethionine-8-amino-7-oxononanoate aminotransferase